VCRYLIDDGDSFGSQPLHGDLDFCRVVIARQSDTSWGNVYYSLFRVFYVVKCFWVFRNIFKEERRRNCDRYKLQTFAKNESTDRVVLYPRMHQLAVRAENLANLLDVGDQNSHLVMSNAECHIEIYTQL
jgi:hypothetical protein